MPAATSDTITVGTEFRSIIADCNALWSVTRHVTDDIYEAVVVNEPIETNGGTFDSDYAGQVDVFTGHEIRGALRVRDVFAEHAARIDAFNASFTPGAVLHIREHFHPNTGGRYIRVEINKTGAAIPVALVGNWPAHDLPRRWPNGTEFDGGFHAKRVLAGEPIRLSPDSTVDSADLRPGEIDPASLPAVNLTLPPVTDDEAARITRVQAAETAAEILQAGARLDGNIDTAIADALAILNQAGTNQ